MYFSSMGKRALDHGSGLSDWEADMIAAQQPLIQEPTEPEPNRSIFGLDLGQLQDFAAFVLVEKIVSHSLPQSEDLVAKPLRLQRPRHQAFRWARRTRTSSSASSRRWRSRSTPGRR